jgi:hypothetical protein
MSDPEAIRRVIEEGHIHGIHQEQDAAQVEWGLHLESRMLARNGDDVFKVSPGAFLEMMIGRGTTARRCSSSDSSSRRR